MHRVRVLWALTGLVGSGHMWYLGHRVSTAVSLSLTVAGSTLLLVSFAAVRGPGDLRKLLEQVPTGEIKAYVRFCGEAPPRSAVGARSAALCLFEATRLGR